MDAPTREQAADGRMIIAAAVGSLEIFRVGFPPSFSHGVIDPPAGYLAVVIDGAVCKTFRSSTSTLGRGCFASIPAGAAHSSVFGPDGCQVVILRRSAKTATDCFRPRLRSCTTSEAGVSSLLGWQIAKELESRDACSPLALEGLALELLARAGGASAQSGDSDTRWVEAVRDRVHATTPRVATPTSSSEPPSASPAHVARAFRQAYGTSVTAYARTLRLEGPPSPWRPPRT